jgi:hypothetical protein
MTEPKDTIVDERLAAAIEYKKRGWVIHPLLSPKDKKKSPGKRPLLKTWQLIEKVTDDDIQKWKCIRT